MEKVNWLKVSAFTSVDGLDVLYDELVSKGIDCMETQDPRELEALMEDKLQYWDYIDEETLKLAGRPCITVYISKNEQGREQYANFTAAVEAARKKGYSVDTDEMELKEEDWANNWKQYFKPLKVGERLIIKPSWEELKDRGERTVLEIDPSVSFGTGGHATTRLCMEYLEKAVFPGCELLDLGCGSGILFVAGMLLKAGHAVAVDIDENAAVTSHQNAERNGIDNYQVYIGNVLADRTLCDKIGYKKYDVVLANIVADVIMGMSGLFTDFIKDGGTLISSGIIIDRKDEVIESIKNAGFDIVNVKTDGEWVGLMAKYKGLV